MELKAEAAAERAWSPDRDWLRARVEALAAIRRPSASPGEREAAEWIVRELRDLGVEGRLEEETLHGTFWWPLGLATAAGALAGLAALRGRRVLGAALGAAAALAAADDLPPRNYLLRRALKRRAAHNVVAEVPAAEPGSDGAGGDGPQRTIVLVAHHDAAHSGLVFHPAIPATLFGAFPWILEHSNTSPGLMWPVVGGPAAAATGALLGSRALTRLGTAISAGSALAMADIGSRDVVPGANDNATGVAVLLAIARILRERPVEGTRVLLVSTSEEALCEGMAAFARRHFGQLPRESTFFLVVDTVGSPHLTVLRGEGMLGVKEYPRAALELVDGLAEQLGIRLFPNLRLRNATDGVFPLAADYQCASLCSCTDQKQPANYHWPTDTPDRVNYGSVADAVRLSEALIRRLDERWLPAPASA